MIAPPEDRRSPLTPQLALRVAVMGSFALAMFAIIFFRLWFLQVLSSDQYAQAAKANRLRSIVVPAPRGRILDRSDTVLVDSTPVPAVMISPPDLPVPMSTKVLAHPPAANEVVYDRLAKVLGIANRMERCPIAGVTGDPPMSHIACTVAHNWALLPYADVQIEPNVNPAIQDYLLERQTEFPGVDVQTVWPRTYPFTSLAAQLFGTVGPISPAELKWTHFHGVPKNSMVGQSGLEYYYDHYLRGRDGAEKVQVDAQGNYRGEAGKVAPVSGDSLRLALDVRLQKVGEQSLLHSMGLNAATSGAFVAMNPDDGEVYAMGSLPNFDPTVFTHPLTQAKYEQLFGPGTGNPQLNRAIQSAGPTGSTFKPITATAALQSGVWNVGDTYNDTGQFCQGTLCRHNAGGAAFGVLDLVGALRVSDDVFFYHLGALMNSYQPQGGALQRWASAYGIGRSTGIDLGGEVTGTLPTPAWIKGLYQQQLDCEHRVGPYRHHQGACAIAESPYWYPGNTVNLAVGQGDVQVTPLQLAVAYGAIANGGTIVRPHLGLEIDAPDGSLLQKISPAPLRHLNINPTYLDAIRQGLHEAAQSQGGTSYDVMKDFPLPVYGKTGTAQYTNQNDYAWYACFVPSTATSKPIVVVVTVPQAGFGAVAAAPVARQILSQWFFGNPGKFIAGSSKTL